MIINEVYQLRLQALLWLVDSAEMSIKVHVLFVSRRLFWSSRPPSSSGGQELLVQLKEDFAKSFNSLAGLITKRLNYRFTVDEEQAMSLETLLEAAEFIEWRSKGKHVVACDAHV